MRYNVLLLLLSTFVTIVIIEFSTRMILKLSCNTYGSFLGHNLPPYKLISDEPENYGNKRSEWYKDLIVNGNKITIGDLYGYFRKDTLLGYAPLENKSSDNDWWISDNLGARIKSLEYVKNPTKNNILIFGDSFAFGSRIPFSETWGNYLDAYLQSYNVLNFGVDGYSIAQSYLRYKLVKDNIQYTMVLMMLVPYDDLWRDINIRRDLAGDWDLYDYMPRYVVRNDSLVLIRSPEIIKTTDKEIIKKYNEELKTHLKQYDRFYADYMFEGAVLVNNLIMVKLLKTILFYQKRKEIRKKSLNPDSEALDLTLQIVKQMQEDVRRENKELVLIILPSPNDLKEILSDHKYKNRWNKLITIFQNAKIQPLDLESALEAVPVDSLDTGYDGTHYGRRTNKIMASAILEYLNHTKLVITDDSID